MEYLLEVKSLTKKYKKKAILNDINLKFEKGKIYGLVGPNGSGKSTLLKCICGLLNYDGVVQNNGSIGYLIEEPVFYNYLNVFDNLYYFSNLNKKTSKEEVKKYIDKFDINYGKKKFKSFSMGMKMKVGICNAFITDTDVIVLDEPTNGLDPVAIKELRNIIKSYSDKTFIISSHLLSEIEKICDEVIFIKDGFILDQIKNTSDSLEDVFFKKVGN